MVEQRGIVPHSKIDVKHMIIKRHYVIILIKPTLQINTEIYLLEDNLLGYVYNVADFSFYHRIELDFENVSSWKRKLVVSLKMVLRDVPVVQLVEKENVLVIEHDKDFVRFQKGVIEMVQGFFPILLIKEIC